MKYQSLLLSIWLVGSSGMADTIHEWLDAAHKAPNQRLSDLALNSAELQSDAAAAALYPKVSLIAALEHFNAPTSLRPVTPTETSAITASGGGYPFVQTMTSAGATVSMPLFVKTLLTNTEKARQNVTSQELKRRISIAERDALLIASNARLGILKTSMWHLRRKSDRSLQRVSLSSSKPATAAPPKSNSSKWMSRSTKPVSNSKRRTTPFLISKKQLASSPT